MLFKKKKQPATVIGEPSKTGPSLVIKKSDSSEEIGPNTQTKLKQFKKDDFKIGKKMGKGQFG